MKFTINGVGDQESAAAEFLEKIGDKTLVAFFAPMGSGKTTFTTLRPCFQFATSQRNFIRTRRTSCSS